jgi:hypothetical protein
VEFVNVANVPSPASAAVTPTTARVARGFFNVLFIVFRLSSLR